MRGRFFKRRGAFTLVELLIVIGIIAILIGVLLPVLSGVAARGGDLKCRANLRSIIQAMHGYAAEHKGAMPWGLLWVLPDLETGTYTSWAGLVTTYMNRSGRGIEETGTGDQHLFARDALSPALVCPEAAQVRPHMVSYAVSWLACVSP